MRTRIPGSTLLVLGVLWQASDASAQPTIPPGSDINCGMYNDYYNFLPPECDIQAASVIQARVLNVCGVSGGPGPTGLPAMDIELAFPDPATLTSGTRLAPVVLVHGGGVGTAYKDLHPEEHPINPYQDLARQLVFKGFVVIQPIDPNIGPGTTGNPYDEHRCGGSPSGALCTSSTSCSGGAMCTLIKGTAHRIMDGVTCMTKRLDGTLNSLGVPRCAYEPGGCISDLMNKVAWNDANRENIIYIGHSAGGIAGLYAPAAYGSALKGLILMDPAKDALTGHPPTSIATATPVVHLYPDWYGPMAMSEKNTTIQLGTSSTAITGPWVPIGVRDFPGCNPNTGCHEANHCNGLGNTRSYLNFGYQDSHESWHGSGLTYCSGSSYYSGYICQGSMTSWCTSTGGSCLAPTSGRYTAWCPAGQGCAQAQKCLGGPTKPAGATWSFHRSGGSGTTAGKVMTRYVLAYAGCLGGISGAKWQPWVTGRQRDLDDSGLPAPDGDTTACVTGTRSGSTTCSAFTTYSSCTLAGCYWMRGADGQIIRKNNGQTGITEYGPGSVTDPRYGYGPRTGVPDQPSWPGWNPTTGAFNEVSERLGTTPSSTNYISCQSGPGFVP